MLAKPHQEAIALIAGKPVVTRQVFDQLLPELRARAFTITGIESANVMQRVRDSIAALPRGTVWDDAKSDIVSELDPWLGDASEQRAELLLRTHGFQAFQASNWRVAQEDIDTTHIQYLATEDDHVRDTHLALNGITLPKDDPFWSKHFPPWEWGCRCRTRAMNPDMVEETRQADEQRNPEDKLVLEGPALRKLEEGHLFRGNRAYNVTAPADRPGGDTAFQWHPDNLRITLTDLEQRYDPEVWRAFETFAKNSDVEPDINVWDWLKGKPLASASAPVETEPMSKVQTFWRSGAPPESGQSYNFKDQFHEKGVSVYEAPFANSFAGVGDRPWYRIEGIEIGRGSDGEPLVKVISAKKLTPKQLASDQKKWKEENPLPDFQVGEKVFSPRVERMEKGDGTLTITAKMPHGYDASPSWELKLRVPYPRKYFISDEDKAYSLDKAKGAS